MGDDNSAAEAVTFVLWSLVALLIAMGAIWYSARVVAAAAGV